MKKRIEDIIAKGIIKIGIECIERYPEAMADKMVESYPEMIGSKMVERHSGMIGNKMVERYPEMMGDKMVERHPEMMGDKMSEQHPEMMGDKMVERHPEMMGDKIVEKHPKMISDKVLDKYAEIVGTEFLKNISVYLEDRKIKKEFIRCLKESLLDDEIYSKNLELIFELDLFKEPNDWIVKQIVNRLVEDENLFSKLFKRLMKESPDLYLELKKSTPEIARNIFLKIGETRDILLGSIGKAEFSISDGRFAVNGYYLPVEVFDSIEIYCGQKLLGLAELGIRRPDVYKKVPNYNSLYSGWSFDTFWSDEGIPESVEAVIKLGDKVLKTESKEVECVDLEKMEVKEPYKVDLNNLNNYNAIQLERIKKFNGMCEELKEYFNWKDITYYHTFLSLQKEIIYGSREIEELFLAIFYKRNAS